MFLLYLYIDEFSKLILDIYLENDMTTALLKKISVIFLIVAGLLHSHSVFANNQKWLDVAKQLEIESCLKTTSGLRGHIVFNDDMFHGCLGKKRLSLTLPYQSVHDSVFGWFDEENIDTGMVRMFENSTVHPSKKSRDSNYEVSLPGTIWLFVSALMGFVLYSIRRVI
jgi:hypothetical protein